MQDDESEKDEDLERWPSPAPKPKPIAANVKPLKSILKTTQRESPQRSSESGDDLISPLRVSRAVKERLLDDDAEIAALEKKLGLKGKKQPKASKEDGLDYALYGSDSEGEQEQANGKKRKRPDDDAWLKDKRQKASKVRDIQGGESQASDNSEDDQELDVSDEESVGDIENPFSEDEVDSDDLEGDAFDSEGAEEEAPTTVRENPYVAPVTKGIAPATKYVPPSMRAPAASDAEALQRLRRQMQGLLNRLSEANLLSILQSVEKLYESNARQHVSSTLVDLLLGLVCDRSALNDTFLILHAGFSTALYKVIGTDFGAQLVERIIEAFDSHSDDIDSAGKETANLIGFLSDLYSFQVVGSAIIFDFVRIFAGDLVEKHTELLLKIIRTSGQQLRQDDPSSLKDIVLLVQKATAKVGEDTLSVRTKFMIETINNLKNNRVKSGVAASAVVSEHMVRIKKTLGSLNTRSVKATEPLRISLADIRDTEKKGKWWLVGASYHDPAKLMSSKSADSLTKPLITETSTENINQDSSVSLQQLARSQGMNTDIRRAIFITILSASDYKDANLRLLKLHLKSKQELEIPRVLIHCAGAEQVYNAYYTLIAKKLCGENRVKKAFQFALWDVFRRMGEQDDDQDDDGEVLGGGEMSMKKIVNLAKMFGTLVAGGGMSIAVLKTLDFAYLQPKTRTFVEVLLTTVLLQVRKKGSSGYTPAVASVFTHAQEAPNMVQGLQYFLRTAVAKAEIANSKGERSIVKKGCKVAVEALSAEAASAGAVSSTSDSN